MLQNYVTEVKILRCLKVYVPVQKNIIRVTALQVVNAINETKRKIDRRKSLSAAEESERKGATEKLISSLWFLKSHAMSISLPWDQSQTELLRPTY